MADVSPAEYARKLRKAADAVKTQNSRAIAARAQVTKLHIVEAAVARTRQARPGWVKYNIDGDVATLRLRTGMGYLTELGSHNHPGGWAEVPRQSTARRRRNAAKKGVTLAVHPALATPYGPKASVQHPALRARPFWEKGLDGAREPGRKAYEKVINETITAALR